MDATHIFYGKLIVTLALVAACASTRGDKSFFFGFLAFVGLCSIL